MIERHFILLIDKYLSGTATESEQQLVEEYLDRLERNSTTTIDNKLEPELKNAIWQQIQLKTQNEDTPEVRLPLFKRKRFRYIAVAASVACLLVLSVWFFNRPSTDTTVVQQPQLKDSIHFIVRHLVNTTGEDENIQLPDSSLIVLANNSELTYRLPFVDKRDITLVGKAYFKVAKDKTKPFTVTSQSVTTTALGTEFLVTAFKNTSSLTVRLYEGKVVIKAVEKQDWHMKKDFYLKPGDEFVYNNGKLAMVRPFGLKTTDPVIDENDDFFADNPATVQSVKGSWYMFNNQSLGQVFDQLAFTYNVGIIYSKKDIRNKYFVGRFNKSDSIDVILKYITLANNLKLIKKENNFYINK